MGLFTSFLCCGGSSLSDSEETHKQPLKRTSPGQEPLLPASSKAQLKAGAKAAVQNTKPNGKADPPKSKADDEHSINESDTITNTHEDSINLPPNKGSEAAAGAPNATAPAEAVPTDTEAGTVQAAPATERDAILEDLRDEDGSSIFDLTKIQEGQAFNPETGFLLGQKDVARFGNKKCLILDLDETLVHSSFKYLRTADFVIPVEIDDQVHHVYVIKRPGVDEFLRKVGKWYEVVVFTASVAKYGDPLLNKLDIHHAVHQRLFRDSCFNYQGNFIKNLSQIGRPLSECIIIDNSPASYIFHPMHSIPISSWFSDTHDNELLDLLPLLEDLAKPNVDDVSLVLDTSI